MVKGIPIQQLGKLLAKGKITPAQIISKEAVGIGRAVSNDIFGYDFVGLSIKLLIFFSVAFIFAKFMEAMILTRGGFVLLANLLGFNIPKADQVPDSLKKLFGTGLAGFKFWDIVKIVAVLLVTAEFIQYLNTNKKIGSKSSPMTIGVFILILSFLAITTIPELLQRIKKTDFSLEKFR